MINILCYGDSNTWCQIPGSMDKNIMLAKRFDANQRWTGVLQSVLGNTYKVIEAGLNGRNTSFDETRLIRPSRNGLTTLPLILEMNYPLDVVVIMLGTNDTKTEFNASPQQTVQALQKMIQFIKQSHLGQNFQAPQVLLIAPAPMHKINSEDFKLFYDDSSIIKSQQFAELLAELAKQEGCAFLDAGKIVKVSDVDGIHIDKKGQLDFAAAIAAKIQAIIAQQIQSE